MIFYLVETSQGHRVCKTQAEAKAISKHFKQIDVPTDKDGLHATLQEFYNMLDTLRAEQLTKEPLSGESEALDFRPEPSPIHQADPVLSTREQFDRAWENFPLALQLHYASLATEAARTAIKPRINEETQA